MCVGFNSATQPAEPVVVLWPALPHAVKVRASAVGPCQVTHSLVRYGGLDLVALEAAGPIVSKPWPPWCAISVNLPERGADHHTVYVCVCVHPLELEELS